MATRWLFKSEPSVYSYQQLVKDKKTVWDGVANFLALKHVKDIKKGELIFIYHTGDEKAAVGVARALSGAYPDPEKDDPRLLVVDVEPVRALAKPVTLAQVKAHPKLKNFDLVKNSRLSMMKVTDEQWEIMEEMAKK
ncbi:MAG: EVE domain-containing protein [Deltaproteobacteria bacterium]|nr:EVE domain-containing protein [Deltaproteobacteria bacterium]